eukprot:TRINITY_DN4485_c0_g1_i2.p2 TRINITY_DN4485_c0_g1~~TRINITY_DN4485_c0_g1_i2.p2  ORF type:complete len:105 (+),score=18.97 TRINITY_DN4485_c0_g1_i2:118-432(+)
MSLRRGAPPQQYMYTTHPTETQYDALAESAVNIRHISEEIEAGLRVSNTLLDELDSDMENASTMLASARRRMKALTNAASSRHMIYLFLFMFVVLGGMYYLLRR